MSDKFNIHDLGHNRIRSIGLLVDDSSGNSEIKKVYGNLSVQGRRYLHTSIDYWLAGHNRPNRYHGWEPSLHSGKYKSCYVFEFADGGRMYGFIHQLPGNSYKINCVLCEFAMKKKNNTDLDILDRMNKWHQNEAVKSAIIAHVKELMEEQAS